MNRHSLSLRMAELTGMTPKSAKLAVDAFCKIVIQELVRGEKVQVLNFGTFSVAKASSRDVRNPHTGELIQVPDRKVVKFVPSKKVKARIRETGL